MHAKPWNATRRLSDWTCRNCDPTGRHRRKTLSESLEDFGKSIALALGTAVAR